MVTIKYDFKPGDLALFNSRMRENTYIVKIIDVSVDLEGYFVEDIINRGIDNNISLNFIIPFSLAECMIFIGKELTDNKLDTLKILYGSGDAQEESSSEGA